MKKVFNILAASAMALALASCSNAFVEKNEAADNTYDVVGAWKDTATGRYTSGTTALTIAGQNDVRTTTAGTVTTVTKAVTFNAPINKDTVDAIKLYSLADASKASAPRAETEMTVERKVVDNVVYLTYSYTTSTFKGLRAYIDATKLASINGQKLNGDGDRIQGEAGDDDYSVYFGTSVGQPKRYPTDLKLENTPTSSIKSSNADGTTVYELTFSFNTKENLVSVLNGKIKFEKYNVTSKSWSEFTATAECKNVVSGIDTYGEGSQVVYTYTLNADEIARIYLTDVQNIKTTATYDGFPMRWTTDNEVKGLSIKEPWIIANPKAPAYNFGIVAYKNANNYVTTIQVNFGGAGVYDAELAKLKFFDNNNNELKFDLGNKTNKRYSQGTTNKIGVSSETYEPSVTYELKTPVELASGTTTIKAYLDPTMTVKVLNAAGTASETKVVGMDDSNAAAYANPVTKGWKSFAVTTTSNPINY